MTEVLQRGLLGAPCATASNLFSKNAPAGEWGSVRSPGGFVTSQRSAAVPVIETLGDPYFPSEAAALLEETALAPH